MHNNITATKLRNRKSATTLKTTCMHYENVKMYDHNVVGDCRDHEQQLNNTTVQPMWKYKWVL